MALFERRDAVDGMLDVLDRERRAIMDGRFDVLERLAAEKERAFQAVIRIGSQAAFMAVRARLEGNQALLQAAAEGIRAAQHLLEGLTAADAKLRIYDASGSITQASGTAASCERRA